MDECERAKRQLGPSGFVPHDTVWAEESGVQVSIHKTASGVVLKMIDGNKKMTATLGQWRWERLINGIR